MVDPRLVTIDVNWPGIPDDEKPFRNEAHPEDLFSLAEFKAVTEYDAGLDGEESDDEPE